MVLLGPDLPFDHEVLHTITNPRSGCRVPFEHPLGELHMCLLHLIPILSVLVQLLGDPLRDYQIG